MQHPAKVGLLTLSLGAILSIAACGTDADELFSEAPGDGSGNAGTGATAGTGASDGTGNSGTGNSGTGNSGTGNSGTGGTGNAGTGNAGTGGAGNAGTGGSVTGGSGMGGFGGSMTGGAGGVPVTKDIECGNSTCPVQADSACCWDNYNLNGAPQAECVMGPPDGDGCLTFPQAGGGFETRIECQVPEHCPTGVCCAFREQAGGATFYTDLVCENDCNWPDVTMCNPAAPNCPVITTGNGQQIQTVCEQSQLLPAGYFVCGTP